MNPTVLLRCVLFVFATFGVSRAVELIDKDFTGKRSASTGVNVFLPADNGRLVVFASSATNIVSSDSNLVTDVFVYDRWFGSNIWNTTFSRWIGTNPIVGEGSTPYQLTADSRYLTFGSSATGFVAAVVVPPVTEHHGPGGSIAYDTLTRQVYVHDLWSNQTSIASISLDGVTAANSNALSARISSDGRFVSFVSSATNLTAITDANGGESELFCRDRVAGITEVISLAPSNQQTLDKGLYSGSTFAMSTNGRYFCFVTTATNVVAGRPRTNINPLIFSPLVYWRDRLSGTNAFVYDTLDGVISPVASATLQDMSGDGRYVCFSTSDTNIVSSVVDTNGSSDLFIRDMQLGGAWMVTSAPGHYAVQGGNARFSADGFHLLFSCPTTALVNGVTDGNAFGNDLFVHDVIARTNTLVTYSLNGTSSVSEGSVGGRARISRDGRFVLFMSYATNLIAGTTNRLSRFYVRDVTASKTLNALRLPPSGPEAGYADTLYDLSGDGTVLLFLSFTNLDSSIIDTNNSNDLFAAPVFPPRIVSLSPPGTLISEGIASANYVLLASTNLTDWLAVLTNKADTQGIVSMTDPQPGIFPWRFYRLEWR